jgi:hypothetical protein
MVNPHPIINKPNKNISYVLELAAGINKNEPRLNTSSPAIIPFLYPYFLRMMPDGMAARK